MSEKAIFAAGCFWGVQYYFDQVPGVLSTIVGYTGGQTDNPTYEQVCSHRTGHAEAVEIEFDPSKVNYRTLLKHFFRMHDPTQLNRQGPDVGDQYRSAIFCTSEAQKELAETEKNQLTHALGKEVVTQVVEASVFWPAEEFHQKYTEKTGHGRCHIGYAPIEN